MSDQREFRIYVSAEGDEAVFKDIRGEELRDLCIQVARTYWPDCTIYVREVTETVVSVYQPGDALPLVFEPD